MAMKTVRQALLHSWLACSLNLARLKVDHSSQANRFLVSLCFVSHFLKSLSFVKVIVVLCVPAMLVLKPYHLRKKAIKDAKERKLRGDIELDTLSNNQHN